jgi:hypothetical protein
MVPQLEKVGFEADEDYFDGVGGDGGGDDSAMLQPPRLTR